MTTARQVGQFQHDALSAARAVKYSAGKTLSEAEIQRVYHLILNDGYVNFLQAKQYAFDVIMERNYR